jgi:hypothetical protein
MKKIIFSILLSFSFYANAGTDYIGCGSVISMSPAVQEPINTGAWIRAKESAGATSGLAAALFSMVPGASLATVAVETVFTDLTVSAIGDAAKPSNDSYYNNVYMVKFKFDSGDVIAIPVLKDESALFSSGRSIVVLYTKNGKTSWNFAKNPHSTPNIGDDNYEKVCSVKSPEVAKAIVAAYPVSY